MALLKSLTLPNGSTGNYIVLRLENFNHVAKEAYASLDLFVSEAQREISPEPLRRVAKFWLRGEKFDQWLAPELLAGLAAADPVRAQLYAAAKAGEAGGVDVISDWGSDVFTDAVDG